MSDFLVTNDRRTHGELAEHIRSIYHEDAPEVYEFHWQWGSMAVSHNLYNHFQPLETEEHIAVMIGGPALCFPNDVFLAGSDSTAGTQAVCKRFLTGKMQWSDDLSGPFVFILINKNSATLQLFTDLLSFIPVYASQDNPPLVVGSHVDALAKAADKSSFDPVSVADFILHGIVTYPYSMFNGIRQISPASRHTWLPGFTKLKSEPYWVPTETVAYRNMHEAANALRASLQGYVDAVTKDLHQVAHFISGGEDSRILAALLPRRLKRDAFIFLDMMNREGRLAKKVADTNGAHFNLAVRSKAFYLDILAPCADLVGNGAQYHHVHTYGFHKHCKLNQYPAVFGGLWADGLLKGSHIKKLKGSRHLPFLPHIRHPGYSAANPLRHSLFRTKVLTELTERRRCHLAHVRQYRDASAEEWFVSFPSSMSMYASNLHGNRRLIRSYEPYMSHGVVKISAQIPQHWKLNRRLFHCMAVPLLESTKWLLHSDGRLPYYPWWVNLPIQLSVWLGRHVKDASRMSKTNQGPWCDWTQLMNSPAWTATHACYADSLTDLSDVVNPRQTSRILYGNTLNQLQQINLLQILYGLSRLNESSAGH